MRSPRSTISPVTCACSARIRSRCPEQPARSRRCAGAGTPRPRDGEGTHAYNNESPAGGYAMSSGTDMDWIASKGAPLHGELAVPGDKSVSHRAIMLASLADGTSRIEGFLEGEDARATETIFRRMGVSIETPQPGSRIVHGVGLDGLRAPDGPLDCGNAGTGMRLLAGLLAGQSFDTTLVGDASLSKRPMRRVTVPLARMGAR